MCVSRQHMFPILLKKMNEFQDRRHIFSIVMMKILVCLKIKHHMGHRQTVTANRMLGPIWGYSVCFEDFRRKMD